MAQLMGASDAPGFIQIDAIDRNVCCDCALLFAGQIKRDLASGIDWDMTCPDCDTGLYQYLVFYEPVPPALWQAAQLSR
jgi:hypothetical protein